MYAQLGLFSDDEPQVFGKKAERAERRLWPDKAFKYYKEHLLEAVIRKQAYYVQYGFGSPKVQPEDWEVFAAILLDDKAKRGVGVDLKHFEIKSALMGASFEYQYHKDTGVSKLEEDMRVDHVFISYSQTYHQIEVRLVEAEALAPTFQSWRADLIKNYSQLDRQRFRRPITSAFVRRHGTVILSIVDGEIEFAVDTT